MWILSRSSLPCIAPWWFHRTSFLGHDLLPSGCAPSVFVESYEGGQPPEGFHSSFRQVHIQWKEGKREFAQCSDWTARIPICCELMWHLTPDLNEQDTCCCVTLLWHSPSAPLYIYQLWVDRIQSRTWRNLMFCVVLFLSHILTVWSISSCHTESFPSPPFHHIAVHQGACDLLTPQYGDLLHHVKVETGDLRLQ